MPSKLTKTIPIGQVIARRRFTLRGSKKAVELRVGAPVALDQDAYCPVQLAGVGDERVWPIYGVDTLQALQLAMRQCERLIMGKGARLLWDGSPAHTSLHVDVAEMFQEAGLGDFLEEFAELLSKHARTVRKARKSR